MLTNINIKNFTIIDELDLDLKSGMSALTGETGAGKSIIIDAVELALGTRATSSIIKKGAERADISITFDISKNFAAQTQLEALELNNNECLIRRTITKDGRSKSFINGVPTTLQPLRELADNLINIHGQHEFQTLLKPNSQRILLDNFANHKELLRKVKICYESLQKTKTEYENLKKLSHDATARAEFLNYQIKELDELNLQEDEIEKINQEHKQLANADNLITNCNTAISTLTENENYSAVASLNHAAKALKTIKHIDPKLTCAFEMLNNSIIETEEATQELRHYLDSVALNPKRLEYLEQRLSKIHDIARKHQVKPEKLLELHLQMQQELATLKNSSEELQNLENTINTLEKDYLQEAEKLSISRKKSAKKLSLLVTANIQQLGMKNGEFTIAVETATNQTAVGFNKVAFMVNTNPGQPLQSLTKVASGGELSRISLAIQVITAQTSNTPALIFDEIDVGIGGATAEIVGKLLRELGEKTQNLCITHLAQVAAKSHQHLRVEKLNQKQQTQIKIKNLDKENRTQEIARMIGGIKITEQTLAHAAEMLA